MKHDQPSSVSSAKSEQQPKARRKPEKLRAASRTGHGFYEPDLQAQDSQVLETIAMNGGLKGFRVA